jgi:PAN domain
VLAYRPSEGWIRRRTFIAALGGAAAWPLALATLFLGGTAQAQEGCKRACASNSQCQAFTFNFKHSVCIQKYGYGQPQVNVDAISGSVRPIVGIDYEGGDLDDGQRGVSVDQCLTLCSTNPRCVGFAYVRAKNWCWQKAQLMRPTVKPDVVSWTKGPTILITPAQPPLGPESPACPRRNFKRRSILDRELVWIVS